MVDVLYPVQNIYIEERSHSCVPEHLPGSSQTRVFLDEARHVQANAEECLLFSLPAALQEPAALAREA